MASCLSFRFLRRRRRRRDPAGQRRRGLEGRRINLHAVLKSQLTRSDHMVTGVQTFGNDRGVRMALPNLNLTPSYGIVGIDDEHIGPLLTNHNALRRYDDRVLQRRENQAQR